MNDAKDGPPPTPATQFTFAQYSGAEHFEIMYTNIVDGGDKIEEGDEVEVTFRVNPSGAEIPTDLNRWTLDVVRTRADSYVKQTTKFSLVRILPEGGQGQYVATIRCNDAPAFAEYTFALVLNNFTGEGTDDNGSLISSGPIVLKSTFVGVEDVTLNQNELTLTVGDEETLTAIVTPDGATNQSVTWSVNPEDGSIITVDNGVVTAAAPGTATITVTTVDGGKTATCTVTVLPVYAGGVTISNEVGGDELADSEYELGTNAGDKLQLYATVTPATAGQDVNQTVIWTSDDEDIATVDADGLVTFVGDEGEVTITATTVATDSDGNPLIATVTINVTAPEANPAPPIDDINELGLTIGGNEVFFQPYEDIHDKNK
jgi:hypothetical protein